MDHISISVGSVDRTRIFYEAALSPLGWACAGWRAGRFVSFKKPGSLALYFAPSTHVAPAHLAFKASSERQVRDFFEAALAAGGQGNGAPGPRPEYRSGYYAAFVLDPDGHNVEAVLGGVG